MDVFSEVLSWDKHPGLILIILGSLLILWVARREGRRQRAKFYESNSEKHSDEELFR